jgi:hypothetical protein
VVIDVRRDTTQPISTPALPGPSRFSVVIITVAIVVYDQLIAKVLELIVLFTLSAPSRTGSAIPDVPDRRRCRGRSLRVRGVRASPGPRGQECVSGGVGRAMGDRMTSPASHPAVSRTGLEPDLRYRCERRALRNLGRGPRALSRRPERSNESPSSGGQCDLARDAFVRHKQGTLFRFFAVMAIAMCVGAILMTKSRGGSSR